MLEWGLYPTLREPKSGSMNKETVSLYKLRLDLLLVVFCPALDIALYEEVEAYTGTRPVLICGVLASQITNLLVESYPKLFHYCHPGKLHKGA